MQILGWSQIICLILGICAEPGGIPHHHRDRYNGPYHTGSKVIYKCHQRKDCQSDGTWTSTTADCAGEIEAKSDEVYIELFPHICGSDVIQIQFSAKV